MKTNTPMPPKEDWHKLPKTRTEAEKLGETRYYTGRNCIHGHDSPRDTSGYHCYECERLKDQKRRTANPKAHNQRIQAHVERYPEKRMVIAARCRAKKKGMACTIEPEDIKIPTHCPLLGIPLFHTRGLGRGSVGPNSPSLDRIDNDRGYTPSNIWVISHRCNAMKGTKSLREFRQELKVLSNSLEALLNPTKHTPKKDHPPSIDSQ